MRKKGSTDKFASSGVSTNFRFRSFWSKNIFSLFFNLKKNIDVQLMPLSITYGYPNLGSIRSLTSSLSSSSPQIFSSNLSVRSSSSSSPISSSSGSSSSSASSFSSLASGSSQTVQNKSYNLVK